ncbi:MAG TPA: methionine adenosyltransferase [Actinomycetota bacterium]|nr:methionine adenosyltransferase [Actinomycetota bacterium]
MPRQWLFTSESVTEGHPDKLADQISDAILDEILRNDPFGRVACETLLTTGLATVAGEISTSTYVDIPKIVRQAIVDVGYDRAKYGFDGHTCGVSVAVQEQSGDIAQGVDESMEARTSNKDDEFDLLGAGDQGMMFGFASDEGIETELMPTPIWLAHRLAQRLAEVRKAGVLPYLRPDGKTQVTIDYEDWRPVRLNTLLISTQHSEQTDIETLLKPDLVEHVIRPIVPVELWNDDVRVLVNPTGRFVTGGPQADTGLTGRKIVVDTYGGMARVGGGCFSGKDPTKVDRSAAYAARYVAKHVVAAGAAQRCEVGVAYAIGVAHPVSINVETFGTEQVSPEKLGSLIRDFFDLRPGAIIHDLDLRRPVFQATAAYGHFGRTEKSFTWENVGRLDDFKAGVESL